MAFFFTRPTRLHLSQECQKVAQTMRRRPLHKKNGKIDFKEKENIEEKKPEIKEEAQNKTLNESSSDEKSSNDSKESVDSLDGGGGGGEGAGGGSIKIEKRLEKRKLSKIVKKLTDKVANYKVALNGNGHHQHHSHHQHASTAVIPTSYSLASHIANSINSQTPHQHVSPRKRILRELEKVSLEDSKRSRPKSTVSSNGNATNSNYSHQQQSSASVANGSLKSNEKAPVSRPISSYSITSLLAHNTSSNSSAGAVHSSITHNNNDSLTTTSHHSLSYQQQQTASSRLNSSPTRSPPPLMQNSKRKSPNSTPPRANSMQSPIQSPSPEHLAHAFHKYRPIATTPTSSAPQLPSSSATSPYNSSYHSPNYMRGSPSPSDALNSRLRTTGNFQHSPSHYATLSPSNYAHNNNNSNSTTPRDSSLSPNVVEKHAGVSSNRSTPGIRTLPKKTAALRQQFSSPTMNESSSTSSSSPLSSGKIKASPSNGNAASSSRNNDIVKPMEIDALLRPSALIPPPPMPHPAAALSHYPYMYSPLSYIPPPAVPPYYHPFYNPAQMMAAAAAAYRFPIPGYPSMPPSTITSSPTSASSSSSHSYVDNKTSTASTNNGQQRNSSSTPPPSAYIAASPWNPIPALTNHSINDGNLIPKIEKDELGSGRF